MEKNKIVKKIKLWKKYKKEKKSEIVKKIKLWKNKIYKNNVIKKIKNMWTNCDKKWLRWNS